MSETLVITGTIFALIGLGYGAGWRGVLNPEAVGVLGAYVVNFALPALIFSALTARPLGDILVPGYVGAYLAGSLATLGIGYIANRRSGATPLPSTFRAMGMSCANSGFVGYPILLIALPAVAAPALALNMIVENLVLLPLILVLAELGRGGTAGLAATGRILRRLVTNPILLAIAAGIAVSALEIGRPILVERTVTILAQSSAAVSLVAIGGTLAALPVAILDGATAAIVAGKLLLHPMIVAAALAAAGALGYAVDRDLQRAGILMAAMPAMSIYPILAGQYGEGRVAAAAMLTMTILSFVTVNALLLILGLGDG